MNRVSKGIAAFSTLAIVALASFATTAQVGAINVFKNPSPEQAGGAGIVTNQGNSTTEFNAILQDVISLLFFIVGIIAVIAIIIGGIRYTTAHGDQSQIQSAKNTIMYAVVGLVVALLAFAIVNFVVARFQ